MADNFEEQYLLFLVPYDRTDNGFYGNFKFDSSGKLVPEDPRLAGKRIPVNPIKNADVWTLAVRDDIRKISRTKTGNLLLRSIKYQGQTITIRPKDADDCNSGTAEGFDLFKSNNLSVGTVVDIQFNPDTYRVGGSCTSRDLNMGGFRVESDEVLLHELVHAFRRTSGKLSKTTLGKGLSFYDNNEEFNAVLVQGIYASERRKTVRSSHFHHFEIDKELNSSMKFFKTSSETFYYVEKFCRENPGFTKGFVNIDTAFNPINAYYECREQVRLFSKSATAQRRDKIIPIVQSAIKFLQKEFK